MKQWAKRTGIVRWIMLLTLIWVGLSAGRSAYAATSSELTERRTDTASGYRVDYIDETGCVAFATDKGYASIVRVVEDGHAVEEAYFDETGEPVELNGYYGRVNLYEDGYCTQITYVDRSGQPTLNSSGYAMVRRTLDDKGRVVQEMYFDAAGKPAVLSSGQSGQRRNAFDEADRPIRFTYLNADGEPILLSAGYSTVRRAYDENGYAKIDTYFDLNDQPVRLSTGYYGVQYIRNASGKHIGSTYLDLDGRPTVCTSGYTTIIYEYDDWNNIVAQSYYDEAGQPAPMSRGQYGLRMEYEGKELIRSYFVDAQGEEMFLLDQYLHQNLWLDALVAAMLLLCVLFLPKRLKWGLLLLYSLFILYMTLIVREVGEQQSNFELFWSYKQFFTSDDLRQEIVQNVLLFIPFGALVCSLFNLKTALLLSIAFSVLIEGAQLTLHLGLCELDDLFNNGMGGLLGALGMRLLLRLQTKAKSLFQHKPQ